eukprot:gnl/TRDRNA2_/TRDRNA2_90456_c0_seq1.p1 gnl/TRDRNA2_/TRDRNA2_90456_c0~~gnl/TRDRNA2_/TRDRNA2_90456_c0_seq1.p1  ORF type:complete len:391 (+),score=39.43 gnl/TRDRNA2_/TRDRNA2_90456_c0_seq1:62-1174(+)
MEDGGLAGSSGPGAGVTFPPGAVRGVRAAASELQCALLLAAFEDLGLRGQAVPVSAWCHGLGRIGVPSTRACEVFAVLDAHRTGEVSPLAFCSAELCQEALGGALSSPLDLSACIHLRYRLLLRGCHVAGLVRGPGRGLQPLHGGRGSGKNVEDCPVQSITASELASCCASNLRLRLAKADAHALVTTARERGTCNPPRPVERSTYGSPSRLPVAPPRPVVREADPSVLVGTLCHQLAIWSTSAPKLHAQTLLPDGPGALGVLARGLDLPPGDTAALSGRSGGGPHAPPVAYLGKTPIEIVVQFKDPARFPWRRLPEEACGRRFEELWRAAHESGHRLAVEAVRLLTDPGLDRAASPESVQRTPPVADTS